MALQWRDSTERYGIVSRGLHWGMAVLLALQFLGMGLKLAVGRTPLTSFFVSNHAPLGVLLLVLCALRIVWGLANARRRPRQRRDVLGRLALAGHGALYLLMLVVPTLALLRLYGSGRGFRPYGIELIAPSERKLEWTELPAELLHGELAWVMLALIAGHVAMALLHRFWWRDGVLARMWGGRARARRPAASADEMPA